MHIARRILARQARREGYGKKYQRAARGGELVQKQDRGVEARVRRASTQPYGGRGSKEPGSSFRGYELTVCAALDEAEKEEDHGDVELD